ncbi:MAG: single-stranded-DNA-specific exonuclease RecJ [Clostridiales bacterium]|nr:single-stranded-DNA-specific exonuclease RecJ [Clostridiales bacterium]
MRDKIWQYKNKNLTMEQVNGISQRQGVPKVITTILLNRHIEEQEFAAFLRKSMRDIINPFDMLDMDKAADRIAAALEKHEKIVIYGDYDVDGITSTTLLFEFLTNQGADVSYYIPDRRDEGYGINIMAVNRLLKQGAKLLITVDCGITAIGEVEFAALSGLDVIITDHHTCKERIPTAAKAIINPKREDDDYPFDALAGVGVAFKLVLALAIRLGLDTNKCFAEFIDLAAIGTVADVVDLRGENRIIVDKGLKAMQTPKRPGVRALLEISGGGKKAPDASTIAFAIAPRLNAAGRLGTATTAVELLLTRDEAKAKSIAKTLDEENRQRQITEQEIYDQALEMVGADPNFSKKKVIVLAHEDWHQGVIGIVASRIGDRFYKPCILISYSNGFGKGSGRSIDGFNLFDALTACGDCLTEFGGHSVAAGLTLNIADLEKFDKAINKYAEEVLGERDLIPKVKIDCPISEKALTLNNAKLIARLEPFGIGNERPVFSLRSATIVYISAVGSEGKHLRLGIAKSGMTFSAIGFNFGEYVGKFKINDKVDIAFQMNINNFRDNETVQLHIKDIIPAAS